MIAVAQEQRIRDILEQLDQSTNKDTENKRKASRVAMHMPMNVTLLSGNAPSTVEIYSRNISLSGLGFVSRRLFRRDERIAIVLRFPKVPAKLILARITFGRYISGGLHEMGSEFLECRTDQKNPELIPKPWIVGAHLVKPQE